ncbi:MAG: GNAT family N-acetyltransferase [Clostridia bacterium]|nr:GNAT family N-acetyltransferase [Clostridia bacterium]
MKAIDKNNKIFESAEFKKDKYKFNIIFKNLDSETLELYSDEEEYMICRGKMDKPAWIWTKDNFDKTKIEEIETLIKRYILDTDKTKFTCKKELYDLLVERKFAELNNDDYFEMGFLICKEAKQPNDCDLIKELSDEKDKEVLTKYWFDDCNEMNGVEGISMEQAEKDVDEYIATKKFYVLKNKEGKIVCMAGYKLLDEQARIGHVYTPKEERRKGYAANLIYQITKELLERGYVPLLYTDYNYIPSNRAYINAGYEDTGILINFSCTKK